MMQANVDQVWNSWSEFFLVDLLKSNMHKGLRSIDEKYLATIFPELAELIRWAQIGEV